MPADQDRHIAATLSLIGELIAELPELTFTSDSVVNYLAPNALEKLSRLQTLIRGGDLAAAKELIERDLGPTLEKLEETLGELVERVPAYKELPAAGKVMGLCREFQEVYRPELERLVSE